MTTTQKFETIKGLPPKFVGDWFECASWEEVTPGFHAPQGDTAADELFKASTPRVVYKESSRGANTVFASVTVTATAAQIGDLLSRADYYASFDGGDFRENQGLCVSARALLKKFSPEQKAAYARSYRDFSKDEAGAVVTIDSGSDADLVRLAEALENHGIRLHMSEELMIKELRAAIHELAGGAE